MFVRVKSTPNSPRQSVQIVASERVGDKVIQRIIRHVGIALNDEELVHMKELAEFIKAGLETQSSPSLFRPDELARMVIDGRKKADLLTDEPLKVDLRQLREESRVVVGIHEVYGKLFDELGFDRVVGDPVRRVQAAKTIKHLVMARIANPASKRQSVIDLERDFGIKLDLNAVYRTLDYIDDESLALLQRKAWDAVTGLFAEKINVVFYDCTTLYFETVAEDDLRDKGYSKDMKFNQSQVLLALMVTKDGLPLGYRLYNGATFEGDTLKDAVAHLQRRTEVDQIIFVADSGLLSKANLDWIEASDKQYIVAARLKNQPESIKKEILDKASYLQGEQMLYKEIALPGNRRLLVNYSQKRAIKDAHDRERTLAKLQKKVKASKSPESFISNFGYRKYLKIENQQQVTIDEEKIKLAEQWDGLHGVITNSKEMPAKTAFEHYKGLWQVEESFRLTKHDLQVRPIYHWTPKRIQAHIAICFMSLVCIRHLSYRVKLQYQPLSPEIIRNELVHVQQSILIHKTSSHRYAIPSKPTLHAQKIYQVMGEKVSAIPFLLK
ncbi:MAG: IS1634 family transposase [Chlorobium sp.]|nr:MAG: IS1634 family transposase [Chlorobium sp.]